MSKHIARRLNEHFHAAGDNLLLQSDLSSRCFLMCTKPEKPDVAAAARGGFPLNTQSKLLLQQCRVFLFFRKLPAEWSPRWTKVLLAPFARTEHVSA